MVHEGAGWAVRVPAGAQVRVEQETVAVDAGDGRRWFDVRWHPATLPPESIAYSWGTTTCTPMMWDQPVEPVPGVWTNGGQCTIGSGRFHALVAIETHGDRHLFTAFLVDHRTLPYEDAWVEYVNTALTLRGGDAPLTPPIDHLALRERVREAAALRPGGMPTPGGGLLSGRVSERIPEVWQARRGSPPPATWGG